MNLPFERMRTLCKDDHLQIKNEGVLLRLVDKYLETRENNKSLKPLQEELDAISGAQKDWESLVKAGVLTPEEAEAKKKAEEEKAEELKKKAQEE